MCGIFGFNFEDRALLKRGMDVLAHRGPDDSGYYTDKNISLGHRRLSVIDLSKKGHQPMIDSNVIVYNGEIYNFKELKDELKDDYKTNSDTEVILKYYNKYGFDCLKHFNGMFAFCIYDPKKKILFLVRDRLGIKPLYYYFKEGKFMFASEIKAILQDKEIKRGINQEAMNDFFTYFYIPYPGTIYNDIYKLEPGYYLVFDLKKNKIKKIRYWDINFAPVDKSESYFTKELFNDFQESVKRHLISDVPLGAYLSGGVDSSSIAAMMSTLTDNITTYSVGFDSDSVVNELYYAKKVAEKLNTNHHELIVNREQAVKILPEIIYHLDEPIVNSAAIPLYYMSKAAKKDMTVVLTGNGGDELFAGYQQHKFIYYTHFLKNFNHLINNPVNRNILKLFNNKYSNFSLKYIKIINNIPEAYKTLMYYKAFTEDDKKKLLLNYNQNNNNLIENFFDTNEHIINQLTKIDLKLLLPEDYLMVDDKINMANSLESRVPFLDYRFVEFASKIPPGLKLKGFTGKYILKKTMKDLLPKDVLKRKKMGFTPPLSYWIDYGFKDMAKSIYEDKELLKLFNKTYLEKSLQQRNKIFPLLTFGLWHKEFIIENFK